MNKLFSISLILVFVLLLVTPAFAEVNRPLKDKISNSSEAAEKKQERQESNMDNLRARAEKEINRRTESLNDLISRVGEFKKLTTTEKTSLTTQVQTEIDSLETLLIKIQADTDIETLKTDVKSIVESYRIYALFIPKIHIMGSADRMLNIADQMSSQAARLETKINEAETNGNDVAELEALLSDMNANIADAKVQAQAAIDAVTPLAPEGYPDNKTTLQSARQMVVVALKDLNEARQDARKIIIGLLKFGKATVTITATP